MAMCGGRGSSLVLRSAPDVARVRFGFRARCRFRARARVGTRFRVRVKS